MRRAFAAYNRGDVDAAVSDVAEDCVYIASGGLPGARGKMIKSNVAGFSIGFTSKSRGHAGGGRELTEIDLLEISVPSKPMHASTRALGWKAATTDESRVPSHAELRERVTLLDAEEKGSKPARKSTGPITVATFDY